MTKRLTRDDFAHMLSFGTFKPVGYSVLAYADEPAARGATMALKSRGFLDEDLIVASSQSMFPKVPSQKCEAADMVAAQGYEVVLMKRHLEIAARNAWWVMVWSPHDADVARLKSAIGDPVPLSAAHYGRIMIEDLYEHVGDAP